MVNFDYLYNPDAAKSSFIKNRFVDKKLGFQVIEHGTILPYEKVIDGKATPDGWGYGGILNSNGEFVRSSHVISGVGSAYHPESIHHSSKTVVYLGMFHSTWGHAITDNIRRLWFLKSKFMTQFKDCPLVYLLCHKFSTFTLESLKNFSRLLEILEVDVNRIQLIEQPTQFEKIILPDESFYHEGRIKFTNEYRETIDRLRNFALKNRTPTSSKKVYYFYGKYQIGEERLAQYFKAKGYETVSPEKLTFDEQLNLLINCESFATVIGSIAHNSLFLRDGAEAVFIPRRAATLLNDYQQAINEVHPIQANYVDASLSAFEFHCYIVSKQLKKFFGDKSEGYDEEDFNIFLRYVKASLSRDLTVAPLTEKYYAATLSDFMTELKQRTDLIAAHDMPLAWETLQSKLSYQTHVHKKSWGDGWQEENQPSNPIEQPLDIQAIKINFPGHKVYCSVYYNEREGWSPEVQSPNMAGTVGKRKSIFGIKIRLDEAEATSFDIFYRMHKFDGTWTAWSKNGEALYSDGQKVNAIQIKSESKSKTGNLSLFKKLLMVNIALTNA